MLALRPLSLQLAASVLFLVSATAQDQGQVREFGVSGNALEFSPIEEIIAEIAAGRLVIVSDGWERADPALLGEQMGRLSRLAHRVVWVNPRSAAEEFEPLAGGMTAALPHVDVLVSGHSLQAVDDVLAAIRGCD